MKVIEKAMFSSSGCDSWFIFLWVGIINVHVIFKACFKEARNSFFWPWSVSLEVKISHRRQTSIFLILSFRPPFQHMIKVYFLAGFLATAVTIAMVMDNCSV